MSLKDREDSVYMAKLAEKAKRYDEMVESMKRVVSSNQELRVEDRNLLSEAYQNVIGQRRVSWKIISNIEKKETYIEKLEQIRAYRERIEEELTAICKDVLGVLDKHLIPTSISAESKVFYYKMKGDYNKCQADFATGQKGADFAHNALVAYEMARDIALVELAPTHHVRLGLALKFSVFYYENLKSSEIAGRVAKAAFDDAIADLDTLSEENYKASTKIMQLLRDNLTLWTSDEAANSYSLPNMIGTTVQGKKQQAPCYSLTGRSQVGAFSEDLAMTPGPGTYNTTDYKDKSPHYSMTSRNVMPGDTTQKPGPGAHSPETVILINNKNNKKKIQGKKS